MMRIEMKVDTMCYLELLDIFHHVLVIQHNKGSTVIGGGLFRQLWSKKSDGADFAHNPEELNEGCSCLLFITVARYAVQNSHRGMAS